MRTAQKHEPITAQPRPSTFVSLLSGWVQQAMDSFFATQRILIDVAMRQNTTTMKAMRESMSDPDHSPASLLSELALEGTANYIEAQRILLDVTQVENDLIMSGVKERVSGSNASLAMTSLIQRSVANFVEMQQEFLTIASKQSQNWLNDRKSGKPYDADRLVQLAKEGMENFVTTQKKFLDVIGEEAARAMGEKATPKPTKTTDLKTLARHSSDALIDAQKRLLDVAAHQVNSNLQMGKRATNMSVPFQLPLAQIAGDGVKSFIDAEKALMDSMVQPPRPHVTAKVVKVKAVRRTTKRTPKGKKTMAKAATA